MQKKNPAFQPGHSCQRWQKIQRLSRQDIQLINAKKEPGFPVGTFNSTMSKRTTDFSAGMFNTATILY